MKEEDIIDNEILTDSTSGTILENPNLTENNEFDEILRNLSEEDPNLKIFIDNYIQYAYYVILERAIPSIFDGLKPALRRILFVMSKLSGKNKSAYIVGQTSGLYHPHGDSSIYQVLVKAVQKWYQRYPLVKGQGNFGSDAGDPAAAFRYTEVFLSEITELFFKDLYQNTVPWKPTYDGKQEEPSYFPVEFPNLLVNGGEGIAVAVASSIPPHNLKEVLEACIYLIDNPNGTLEDILKIIKGPDLPTGGEIFDYENLIRGYETGNGRFSIKARYEIKSNQIIFKEIPFQVNRSDLIKKIEMGVKEGKIQGISSVKDSSNDQNGTLIKITLKNNVQPEVVVSQLYEFTPFQSSFSMLLYVIDVDGKPKLVNLLYILKTFLNFRENILIRKTFFQQKKTQERIHELFGLLIALENTDEILETIKNSNDIQEAKIFLLNKKWKSSLVDDFISSVGLTKKESYTISQVQLKTILDMKFSSLVKIESEKLIKELKELRDILEKQKELLNKKELRNQELKNRFFEIIEKFSDERRSEILIKHEEKNLLDLIPNEETILFIDKEGYIKRLTLEDFKLQKRGGKGKNTSEVEGRFIKGFTRDKILFLMDNGKAYSLYAFEIKLGGLNTKGVHVNNLINNQENSKVLNISIIEKEKPIILFISPNGLVRRNDTSQFLNINNGGKKFLDTEIIQSEKISNIQVIFANEEDLLFLITKKGQNILTKISNFRTLKSRNSLGIKACKLSKNDIVVNGSAVINSEKTLIFSISSLGFGKLTPLSDYRITNRGATGTKSSSNKKRGNLLGTFPVTIDHQVILLINNKEKEQRSIRISLNKLNPLSRIALGPKLCALEPGDEVVDIVILSPSEYDEKKI